MINFFKKRTDASSGRGLTSGALTALILAVVVLVNAVAYAVQQTYSWYLYRPEREKVEISDTARTLISTAIESGKKVEIIFCMTRDEVKNHDTGSLVLETADLLANTYPEFFSLDFYNIVTKRNQHGERIDVSRFSTDEEGVARAISKHSVIFSTPDNFHILGADSYADFYTIDSAGTPIAFNGEEVMISSALRTLEKEERTAYFTMYHGEIADPAFYTLLSCAGFAVDVIDLRRQEIPEDAGLIVISAPQSDFERGVGIPTEIERLTEYVEGGGSLYVSLDPYLKTPLPVLENFLATYGIGIARTEIAGYSATTIVKDSAGGITQDGFTLVSTIAEAAVAAKVGEYRDRGVLLSHVGAMTLDESLGAKPLLVAAQGAVTEAGGETVDREGGYAVAAYTECGEGEGKIVVIPSIYLTASDALVTNAYSNRNFFYALIEELYGIDAQMPYGCRVLLFDNAMLENLRMSTARLYTAALMLIPAALACAGAVVLIRRKNR